MQFVSRDSAQSAFMQALSAYNCPCLREMIFQNCFAMADRAGPRRKPLNDAQPKPGMPVPVGSTCQKTMDLGVLVNIVLLLLQTAKLSFLRFVCHIPTFPAFLYSFFYPLMRIFNRGILSNVARNKKFCAEIAPFLTNTRNRSTKKRM